MNKYNTKPYDTNEHSLQMIERQGKGKTEFVETEFQFGKNIFDYVLDNSMYVNTNKCDDYTPPFLSYVPIGIPDIEIESKLKGVNKNEYLPANPLLAQNNIFSNEKEYVSKNECKEKIIKRYI